VLTALALVAMLCAAVPAAMFCANLRLYREPESVDEVEARVSVLIPARNEEAGIEAAVAAVLRSVGVTFEVVVMDDASTDRTAEMVAAMATRDERVRLVGAPVLPAGWNGKQHACWALAQTAQFETLCFIDADVRLEPDALARMAAFMQSQDAALVSGFPRQITGTWMEWLLLPLIHFVLLGFLPLARMRAGTDPAFAAGCGQFMMVRRDAYLAAGGHAAIRGTMHDGLLLPRLLRQASFRTDLADMTRLATCRMYTNARQVWNGLAKNATEGLGAPARIVPVSLLLILGQVVPVVLGIWLWVRGGGAGFVTGSWVTAFVCVGMMCAWLPRVLGIQRFRQDWRGAVLHPVGILVLVALQWFALLRKLRGRTAVWKERSYSVG
jgi:hypothetical protein